MPLGAPPPGFFSRGRAVLSPARAFRRISSVRRKAAWGSSAGAGAGALSAGTAGAVILSRGGACGTEGVGAGAGSPAMSSSTFSTR